MHYAVPEVLHGAGLLDRFYTDLLAPRPGFVSTLLEAAGRCSGECRRLLGRRPKGIPDEKLIAFPGFGLEYTLRLRKSRQTKSEKSTYLWAGRRFCELTLARGLGQASTVYMYNSAALEVFMEARRRGVLCVLEQTIAPMASELRILAGEHLRFPGWEAKEPVQETALEYAERERHEWSRADLIVCGSDFVAQEIAACDGPADRCKIIPYGYNAPVDENRVSSAKRGAMDITVLFAGTVGLRKGIGYLAEAMAHLKSGRIRAIAAGPTTLRTEGVQAVAKRVELLGAVPRADMTRLYGQSDIFVLPSMCEGSATVSYEALAAGLPVVTTPNAGTVVRDGVEGFVVPAGDPQALAERIEQLAADRVLRQEMSENARRRAQDFTVAKYGERLVAALMELRGIPAPQCAS